MMGELGMSSSPQRRHFVHLAYLDDSDTKNKRSRWQVMSAVLIEDRHFKLAEVGCTVAQNSLGLSPEQLEKFEEFHACELYGGYKAFEGIDQERRFDAMRRLLFVLDLLKLDVVYGAVDLDRLGNELYASADPKDICFRICINGVASSTTSKSYREVVTKLGANIDDYTTEKMAPPLFDSIMKDLTLLIVDECDSKIRNSLQRTYRDMRTKMHGSGFSSLHDDMYFGDSRYAFGLQIADACSYFISCHLDGDKEKELFYQLIEPRVTHCEIYPAHSDLPQAHLLPANQG